MVHVLLICRREVLLVDVGPTAHMNSYHVFELSTVGPHHLGGILVERVVGVGVSHQKLKSHNQRIYTENRLPVLAKNIKAYVSLEIDVRVIDLESGRRRK